MKEKLKKEHFEVLLEGMKDDIKLVLEGHTILNNKIDLVEIRLTNRIDSVDSKVEDVKMMVKEMSHKLEEHILMPAHV
ncbi:hypothetical protein A3J90_03500 [candidate division WOR-1 bacterium RIFOXYC2_FULL_37_10]|uniref:Uncharacterized protein n=1 Tax=candidate division WOR-1 bacterium RIFOXYB2_FULL_37_13 TaxID=1802579 RepID=A0A1F4SQZ7_UNCSA|nr:MAG: hypothetical protein A2310_00560 [candidate division WOR-1 bacterium RIFOXYB2_FULL_37_13]OGC33137.1 MAG: hypothetical protein A3J90_03500 [candidate division WOR-1 bacterium RIFOXYC2_FULL_37_10]